MNATIASGCRFPLWLGACLASLLMSASAWGFDLDALAAQAERLAGKPYQKAETVAEPFRSLNYDQWSGIRFRRDQALWPDTAFRLLLNPAGYLYETPVALHLIEDGEVRPLDFDPALYRHDPELTGAGLPQDLGFAGFRLLHQLNRDGKFDEVLSFLGASYFRALPAGGWYGLSARGVAVDTVTDTGEEFPGFTAFWLQKPEPGSEQVRLYALLDSPSLTGAYRFTVQPGAPTVMAVAARLYMRADVVKLGLAPLTSMFLYSIGDHKLPGSPFPAVHDSDGLLIAADDVHTWRPLANPPAFTADRFAVDKLSGFGLLQRDRNPRHFQSLNLHYQDRPSAWIEPTSDWGAGHVELVQLPSDTENYDNIVTYWVPEDPPGKGESIDLAYRIHWQLDEPLRSPAGRVVATRIGGDDNNTVKFVLDFVGGGLAELDADAAVESHLEVVAGSAEVVENRNLPNPRIDGWRMVFQVLPDGQPATVRAHLARDGKPLTETWDYVVRPR